MKIIARYYKTLKLAKKYINEMSKTCNNKINWYIIEDNGYFVVSEKQMKKYDKR